MTNQNTTNQDQQFCPEVERSCMGWFDGECSFKNNLHDAVLFEIERKTLIGDTPLLNKLVKEREEAVREQFNSVASQLAQVVLSAGENFKEDQCQPVKYASRLFEIVPVGEVGVLPPDPRMSSRAIYINYNRDDDEEKPKRQKRTISIPRIRLFDTPVPEPVYVRKQHPNH